ncbi:hypothetical protein [Hymenobacter sp. CRA2]|uniref:hypothetical protein n=1 Tax=Hymenobacter sp. CRA2 TaxID=1955620 RepID=UPI0009901208|nr:hypothetical protein [Hymenobacter sp. CRA2]OON70480.1 hypothetical protein B0919_00140 [Hymenobacter sp. CRA2]
MIKRRWPALLLLLLVLDLAYSFWQHFHVALGGDLSGIVVPDPWYEQVLIDPLGLRALRGEVYAAPNRFFQHQTIAQYFRAVPLWLQAWAAPIDSVYLACAVAKTAIQALLIYLLGVYISGRRAVLNRGWVLAAALVTPLFQTNGWNGQIGIIDKSVVYTFCYALPVALLLLFLLPYFRAAAAGQPVRLSVLGWVGVLGLVVFLSLNSPIITGVIALLGPGVLAYSWWQRWRTSTAPAGLGRAWVALRTMPVALLVPFGLFLLLSLYSLYLGRFNAENFTHTLPLAERYARLPLGIYYQFKQKLGWPLMLLLLGVNRWLLGREADTPTRRRLLLTLRWLGVFAAIYIVLLPLGGYREYRPYILRRDTLLPVIIGVVYWYGASSYYLLRLPNWAPRRWYLPVLGAFSLLFLLTDTPVRHDSNTCEREAMATLAAAPQDVVVLDNDCPVMAWTKFASPQDSETNAKLLLHWGVTKKKTLYYHR